MRHPAKLKPAVLAPACTLPALHCLPRHLGRQLALPACGVLVGAVAAPLPHSSSLWCCVCCTSPSPHTHTPTHTPAAPAPLQVRVKEYEGALREYKRENGKFFEMKERYKAAIAGLEKEVEVRGRERCRAAGPLMKGGVTKDGDRQGNMNGMNQEEFAATVQVCSAFLLAVSWSPDLKSRVLAEPAVVSCGARVRQASCSPPAGKGAGEAGAAGHVQRADDTAGKGGPGQLISTQSA